MRPRFSRRNPYRAIGHARARSKTQAEYADHLKVLENCGTVLWWREEPFNIRLGPIGGGTAYWKPDFLVCTRDEVLEVIEVKGYIEQHALVRIKAAAEMFPVFRFRIVKKVPKKDGGGWTYTEVS